jgi:hypothetical protein
MCVYICVCTRESRVHTHTSKHVHTRTHTCTPHFSPPTHPIVRHAHQSIPVRVALHREGTRAHLCVYVCVCETTFVYMCIYVRIALTQRRGTWAYLCMCVCVCMCEHMYVCESVCVRTEGTCGYLGIHLLATKPHTRVHGPIHTCRIGFADGGDDLCIRVCVCVYACVYVHECISVCVCMHMCICVCTLHTTHSLPHSVAT